MIQPTEAFVAMILLMAIPFCKMTLDTPPRAACLLLGGLKFANS